MKIRPIEKKDNATIARIIRDVLTEFGANRPGFAWQDPELDAMTAAYGRSGRAYWVIEARGVVVGGAGIGEFSCNQPHCCELQKMYLIPSARGVGWGECLIDRLLDEACAMQYHHCYLETLKSMVGATALYRKKGFELLASPLGDSGHNACDEWYLKELTCG